MALPTFGPAFAGYKDLPTKQILASWLANKTGQTVDDCLFYFEHQIWAKLAAAYGGSKGEEGYVSLPKQYAWSAIYNGITGSTDTYLDWNKRRAMEKIVSAYYGVDDCCFSVSFPIQYLYALMVPFVDQDVVDYFYRASITDPVAKVQIDQFVRQVKLLGIWDKMICWPMVSTLNKGSGTTVYSLGGLGIYNGTMVGSPTWGYDGLAFSGGTQYISLPMINAADIANASGGFLFLGEANVISRTSAGLYFTNRLNSKINGGQINADATESFRCVDADNATGQRYTSDVPTPVGTIVGSGYHTYIGHLKTDSTGFSIFDNGGAATSISTWGSAPFPPPFVDGNPGGLIYNIGTPWTGSVKSAFSLFALTSFTEASANSLKSTYKSTLGIDRDAAAFCSKANIVNTTSIDKINSFVKGVKDLGLWSSMICWPMASSINAGKGTTVYSLGGAGSYDGTMVNGPSWSEGGIVFRRILNQHILTNLQLSGTQNCTFYAASSVDDDGGGSGGVIHLMGTRPPTITATTCVASADDGYNNIQSSFVIAPATITPRPQNPTTSTHVFEPTTPIARVASNGGAYVSATPSSTPLGGTQAPLVLGHGGTYSLSSDRGFNGTIIFAAAFANTALTEAQSASFNNLYRSTIISELDRDAIAFCNKAGITNSSYVSAIESFVKGIKNLGLWNSMVCWPLRSTQNAGTGTTVYSLGGLGTFNGTLVNGPTWGVDGIDFDGNNDRMTLSNGSFGTGNAATSIWAFLKNETNAARMVALSQGNNNNPTDAFSLESPFFEEINDSANIAFTESTIAAKSTAWKSLFIGNTSAGFRGKDGGTVTEFSLNNALNKSGNSCAIGAFGNPEGVAPFDGLIAAVIRIDATPTTTLNGQIHNLYKQTLGIGLGLP